MKTLILLTASATAMLLIASPAARAASDEEMIKNAEMAAPSAVSAEATVYAMTPDGKLKTLREGKNGWWCMPDDPSTPDNDPMCGDANSFAWAGAWMSHTEPPKDKIGIMYMLQGGPAGSNVDPYQMAPKAGENWVATGPHIMVVGGVKLTAGYSGGATPDTTKPYIMWQGTPYEHLMVPVK